MLADCMEAELRPRHHLDGEAQTRLHSDGMVEQTHRDKKTRDAIGAFISAEFSNEIFSKCISAHAHFYCPLKSSDWSIFALKCVSSEFT